VYHVEHYQTQYLTTLVNPQIASGFLFSCENYPKHGAIGGVVLQMCLKGSVSFYLSAWKARLVFKARLLFKGLRYLRYKAIQSLENKQC